MVTGLATPDDYPLDPFRSKKTVVTKITANGNTNTNLNSNVNANLDVTADMNLEENINDDFVNEDIIDLSSLDGNVLSPSVDITFSQKEWNSYIFRPKIRGILDTNLTYHWDFGDGSYSSSQVAEHRYENSGKYEVRLKVTGANDLSVASSKKISISFFNLGNFNLIISLGGLSVLLLIVLILLLFKRNKHEK